MSVFIDINNVSLDFPVYSNTGRSLKKQLFKSNIFKTSKLLLYPFDNDSNYDETECLIENPKKNN